MFDANDFDFVELMQTVESAHMRSVRSSFTAEARRVSCTKNRQFIFVEDDVAEEVCYGNFCSWDEVQIVESDVVHLPFLIRKLSGSISRCFIHQMRNLIFLISRFGVTIEEIADQRALKSSTFSLVYGKSCAGDFHAEFKMDDVV